MSEARRHFLATQHILEDAKQSMGHSSLLLVLIYVLYLPLTEGRQLYITLISDYNIFTCFIYIKNFLIGSHVARVALWCHPIRSVGATVKIEVVMCS